MERKFSVRSNGLYKKANTLFNLLGTKVAVIVQTEQGATQGYVSHEESDWPDFYNALGLMGLEVRYFMHPDNFDTVADRNRRNLSFSSSGLSTTPSTSTSGSATEHDDSDPQMMGMLTAVLEEPGPSEGETDTNPPTQAETVDDTHLPSLQPPTLAQSPQQAVVLWTARRDASEAHASESQVPSLRQNTPRLPPGTTSIYNPETAWTYGEMDVRPRRIILSTDGSKRKRRSEIGHEEKRRRMVTRSQGDKPVSRKQ